MRSRFARWRHRFGSGRCCRSGRCCGGSHIAATTRTARVARASARMMELRLQAIQKARLGAGIAATVVLLEFGEERTAEQRGAASGLASRSTGRSACRVACGSGCTSGCCARIAATTTVRTVTDQGQTSFQFVQDAHASAVIVARRSGGGTASAIGAGHAGRGHENESGCHRKNLRREQGIGIVRGIFAAVAVESAGFLRTISSVAAEGGRECGRVRSLDFNRPIREGDIIDVRET